MIEPVPSPGASSTSHRIPPPAAPAAGPPVSVVVTVLNEGTAVDELIAAVARQLGDGDELVLVDGGSTDDTPVRIHRWREREKRIRLLSVPGANIAAGRNAGVAAARNEVIACTDAGCRPASGWLGALRSRFLGDDPPSLVTGIYRVGADGPLQAAMAVALYPDPEEASSPTLPARWYGRLLGRTFDAAFATGRSVAFTRDSWKVVGGFPEHLDAAEDVVFARAIVAAGRRCVLSTEAEVEWAQRSSLAETARMFYRYGVGDGRSGDRTLIGRNLVRCVAYLGAPLVWRAAGRKGRLAVAAGAVGYLSMPLLRARRRPRPVAVAGLVPVAVALKDLSKAAGCLRGLVDRLREGPTERDGGTPVAGEASSEQGDPVPVTFVSSHAKAGGAERYLETMVGELGSAWVRDVVALDRGPLCDRFASLGHRPVVIETGPRAVDILGSAWRLRRFLLRRRPRVVHANGVKAALVGVLATPGTRIPVIWVKHDFAWDGWLARLIATRCREVVGVSNAVTETFRGPLRRRVRVVHNGVPTLTVDRAAARAKLLEAMEIGEAPAVISLIGRMYPVKGHLGFLDVVAELRSGVVGLRVAFVGGEDPALPDHAARIRQRVRALGLEDVVSMLGHRDDAIELMAGSDAVVVPSVLAERWPQAEGLPLAALESLAVGTPVVAYSLGGIPELLGDCGVLVPPGDREALTDAITQVLQDPALRRRCSRCGQERVRRRFSLEGMVGAMSSRYREAGR
jgi:glycosyltransferase involved in cell wall biosynthesis/GT2 family glycosyltransferase